MSLGEKYEQLIMKKMQKTQIKEHKNKIQNFSIAVKNVTRQEIVIEFSHPVLTEVDLKQLFIFKSKHVVGWSIKEFTRDNVTIALEFDQPENKWKNETVVLLVAENNVFKSLATN